jgi:uncharacterized protein (TIGR02145 family)
MQIPRITWLVGIVLTSIATWPAQAQECDPSQAPTGLEATYTQGVGAELQWTPVAGSQGVQIKAIGPDGSVIGTRLAGFELSSYLVPDFRLQNGSYTWRMQAVCSSLPPYQATPISPSHTFWAGDPFACPASLMDVDGHVYDVVDIGGQCWSVGNYRATRYRNGEPIPHTVDDDTWDSTTEGAYAYYQHNASYIEAYGLLYNWFAAVDSRGLCPDGWHVASESEWIQLIAFLEGDELAGGPLKATGSLADGSGYWQDPNTGATNSTGFSGLPGGYRNHQGTFNYESRFGYWWSTTEHADSLELAWLFKLCWGSTNVPRKSFIKQDGLSIRCVRD